MSDLLVETFPPGTIITIGGAPVRVETWDEGHLLARTPDGGRLVYGRAKLADFLIRSGPEAEQRWKAARQLDQPAGESP